MKQNEQFKDNETQHIFYNTKNQAAESTQFISTNMSLTVTKIQKLYNTKNIRHPPH